MTEPSPSLNHNTQGWIMLQHWLALGEDPYPFLTPPPAGATAFCVLGEPLGFFVRNGQLVTTPVVTDALHLHVACNVFAPASGTVQVLVVGREDFRRLIELRYTLGPAAILQLDADGIIDPTGKSVGASEHRLMEHAQLHPLGAAIQHWHANCRHNNV